MSDRCDKNRELAILGRSSFDENTTRIYNPLFNKTKLGSQMKSTEPVNWEMIHYLPRQMGTT